MSSKKNSYISTEILPGNNEGIYRAAQILNDGGLVAFPTETVYGLGADATNSDAIDRLYQAKGRPHNNPLIIHVYDKTIAKEFVEMDHQADILSSSFWPGPLTLVLKQNDNINIRIAKSTLSNLQTTAIRVPGHPIARQILKLCDNPIAAPSANMSGKLSTTRFEDVLACMSGKVNAIVDGGPCPIGIESTIVEIRDGSFSVLRPGRITEEDIKLEIGKPQHEIAKNEKKITSPGQFKSHYRPETPIRLNVICPRNDELLLAFGPLPKGLKGLSLSEISDPEEAAMNLYSALADLDNLAKITKSTSIAVQPIPPKGVGLAINDRLQRAAYTPKV